MAAVEKWRDENIQSVVDCVEASELRLEQVKANLKKTLEQARSEQLKNDITAGKLIDRLEVEQQWYKLLTRLKHRLDPLGTEIANGAPAELKAIEKKRVDEAVRIAYKEIAEGGIG